MALSSPQVTVTTAATLLASGRGADHVTAILRSPSATIYLGGPTVDTTNGLPFNAGESLTLDLYAGDVLYAVAATGTPTVNVLVTRQ